MSAYTIINPTTAKPVQDIHLADLFETDVAIEKADRAFQSWRHVSPGDRAKLLRKFALNHADAVNKIRACLNDQQYLEARRIAHTLKGLSGTLGALELQRQAEEVEKAIKGGCTTDQIDGLLKILSDNLDNLVANITGC